MNKLGASNQGNGYRVIQYNLSIYTFMTDICPTFNPLFGQQPVNTWQTDQIIQANPLSVGLKTDKQFSEPVLGWRFLPEAVLFFSSSQKQK